MGMDAGFEAARVEIRNKFLYISPLLCYVFNMVMPGANKSGFLLFKGWEAGKNKK